MTESITIGALRFVATEDDDGMAVRIFGAHDGPGGYVVTEDEWQSLRLAAATFETHARELARVQAERDQARSELVLAKARIRELEERRVAR